MYADREEKLEVLEHELGPQRMLMRIVREQKLRRLRKEFTEPGGVGLLNFIRHFWEVLEPGRPFVEGWALLAMCKHLDAVSNGQIQRLLINVPPGSMKSLLVNVFWPAWEWGALKRPDLRYVSFSYASHLTWRDNIKFLDLIKSPDYRDLWPKVETREESKIKVANKSTGWKFATSIGGVGTGERGDRVILDDPHNVREAESDTVRVATTTWVREAMSNRLNDMDRSAIVVIMQRVHEDDVSGMIIADKLGYVHLCIPLEFEPDKRCVTYVKGKPFWADPRRVVDQCFWPERFTPGAMVAIKLMGEHAYAGQYQQRPEPRGGGLFKRDYWRRWEIVNNRFPTLHYIVASLDGAFTEKTANDPSGFTCWGVFTDHDNNQCAITLTAWRKHLPLHKNCRAKRKDESWAMYKAQTEQDWGLIQWLHYECNRWGKGVDKLLIEDKANGHDVANEMLRLFKYSKFIVQLVDPEGMDKWARAVRVQPVFAEGLIYTLDEKLGKKWVSELITELAMFPRGRFDDQVDSSTQALWFLRKNGFLVMADERRAALVQKEEHKRKLTALYPM